MVRQHHVHAFIEPHGHIPRMAGQMGIATNRFDRGCIRVKAIEEAAVVIGQIDPVVGSGIHRKDRPAFHVGNHTRHGRTPVPCQKRGIARLGIDGRLVDPAIGRLGRSPRVREFFFLRNGRNLSRRRIRQNEPPCIAWPIATSRLVRGSLITRHCFQKFASDITPRSSIRRTAVIIASGFLILKVLQLCSEIVPHQAFSAFSEATRLEGIAPELRRTACQKEMAHLE